jgi:GntP family gluconate:H+ symporter
VNLVADSTHSFYLVGCAAATVLLLLWLIARVRLHPALALLVGAMGLGMASGMPLDRVPLAFTTGVGNLMGHVAVVLALGAVLGQLLARSGGAAALGRTLVEGCGPQGMPWALLATGLLVGMPVFFEVGLVLLLPIVAEVARRSGKPPILVGLPVLAGLSIVHAVFPPHPAAMLAATQFHADLGRTMLLGAIAGLPAAALAGPLLSRFLLRHWRPVPPENALVADGFAENKEDSVGAIRAAAAILLPVLLICLGSWADGLAAPGSLPNRVLHFTGSPDLALLIAVLAALAMLGPHIGREHGASALRNVTAEAFPPIAGVLVVLAAAGGLSGVLRESGAAQATVSLALGAHVPPLLLAWMLAAVVRIAMGSSTVAMAVAAGVLAPMAGSLGVRPELLVLATGTGSIILSHVNDPGFWMIQSFFKTDLKETLASWTVLETILSLTGLGMTLLLSAF